MMGPQQLCCLYLATAGLQGNNLGSDEEEIVLLIYIVVDVTQKKLVGVKQYLVKPYVADLNENILSEQIQTTSQLTEDKVKNSGQPLETVIFDFDRYLRQSLNIDPCQSNFRFVTDGQLPLRQCLHPESYSKNIELKSYYNMFYDLRKEVHKYLVQKNGGVEVKPIVVSDMQQDNVQDAETIGSGGLVPQLPTSIAEMMEPLGLLPDVDNNFYVKEAKDMANIVIKLANNGHRFENPEVINLTLEPGICSKTDEIESNCVVRARGLPWQSSDQDIAKFFRGLNIAKGGVALCLSPQGRRNGEALIRFCSQEHRDMGLKRHKHHIGSRYIEVYRANGEDFLAVAGGSSNEALTFLSRGASVIIRMRGLPYDCTAQQVLDFFANGENPCYVLDGVDGVLFVKRPDGRATGDAFVLFANESDAAKATSKHRELIGSRYIELFRSTTAEVQQVLNRSMDPKTYSQNTTTVPQAPLLKLPLLPQHVITSGTRKDCIRLRGLPYEAQVEHILEFLGEYAKNIIFQGVHMVYNSQAQPSGEAFIQMDSEKSAGLAAYHKHKRYMMFGKKQRYIEVFQCSGEDMNLVLNGGIPAPVSPSKNTATALLSPGGTLLAPAAPPPYHGSPNFGTHANGPTGSLYNPQGPPALPPPLGAHPAAGRFYPHPIYYWTYPSPPVSPTNYYAPAIGHPAPLQNQPGHQQALMAADCIPISTMGPIQTNHIEAVNALGHRSAADHEKHIAAPPIPGLIPAQYTVPFPHPDYVEIFMA